MVESGDPFRVPEQDGIDSFSLGRQLEQFRQMLEAKEANTELLRRALIAVLGQWVTDQNQAAQKNADVQLAVVKDLNFPKSDRKRAYPIPGTSDFILQQFGPTGDPQRYATEHVDGLTGKVTPWNPAPKFPHRFLVSSDGKQLYYIRTNADRFSNFSLVRVPLTPAGPAWKNAPAFPLAHLPREKSLGRIEVVTIGGKDFILTAEDWENPPTHHVNPETGETVALAIEPLKTTRWAALPGTDLVCLTVQNKKDATAQLAKVGDKGIELLPQKRAWVHSLVPNVVWHKPDGPVVMYEYERAEAFLPGKTDGVDITVIPPELKGKGHDTYITGVALHPDGATAAVLISPQGVKQVAGKLGQHVAWVDLATQRVIARISTPPGGQIDSIEFAPDGRLITQDHGTPAILNLEGRR